MSDEDVEKVLSRSCAPRPFLRAAIPLLLSHPSLFKPPLLYSVLSPFFSSRPPFLPCTSRAALREHVLCCFHHAPRKPPSLLPSSTALPLPPPSSLLLRKLSSFPPHCLALFPRVARTPCAVALLHRGPLRIVDRSWSLPPSPPPLCALFAPDCSAPSRLKRSAPFVASRAWWASRPYGRFALRGSRPAATAAFFAPPEGLPPAPASFPTRFRVLSFRPRPDHPMARLYTPLARSPARKRRALVPPAFPPFALPPPPVSGPPDLLVLGFFSARFVPQIKWRWRTKRKRGVQSATVKEGRGREQTCHTHGRSSGIRCASSASAAGIRADERCRRRGGGGRPAGSVDREERAQPERTTQATENRRLGWASGLWAAQSQGHHRKKERVARETKKRSSVGKRGKRRTREQRGEAEGRRGTRATRGEGAAGDGGKSEATEAAPEVDERGRQTIGRGGKEGRESGRSEKGRESVDEKGSIGAGSRRGERQKGASERVRRAGAGGGMGELGKRRNGGKTRGWETRRGKGKRCAVRVG